MSVSFDPRPLTEPVDPRDVAAYTKATRSNTSAGSVIGIVMLSLIGLVAVGVLVPVGITMIGELFAGGEVLSGIAALVATLAALALIAWLVVKGVRASRIRHYRLHRFAEANGMTYIPRIDKPNLPGMIFHEGDSRMAERIVRGERPRFVEFANYQYETGSGKNRTTHNWGYIAVRLDAPLPNIVLDSSGNNSLFGSNLPNSFNKKQRLGLEGDFDKHFALYCPAGYERDALYLFTPDIMQRFIDKASRFDVEIVDDWLFLYAQRDISTLDPATWERMFDIVAALMVKFDQWGRWRDERLDAPAAADAASTLPFVAALSAPVGVAPQGRRLKQSVPWVLFIVLGAAVGFGLLTYFL